MVRGRTAGRSRTSVSGLLGFLVCASSQIVRAGVDDDGALFIPSGQSDLMLISPRATREKTDADDALRPDQLDQLVLECSVGIALSVRRQVAKITDVTLFVVGSTMGFAVRVD